MFQVTVVYERMVGDDETVMCERIVVCALRLNNVGMKRE
jgi:hypothetical protein